MSIISLQWEATCNICNNKISAGTRAEWTRATGARHLTCAPAVAATAARTGTCEECGSSCNPRYRTCFNCGQSSRPARRTPRARRTPVATVTYAAPLVPIMSRPLDDDCMSFDGTDRLPDGGIDCDASDTIREMPTFDRDALAAIPF